MSNDTTLSVFKKITPFLGVNQNIVLRFGLPFINNIPTLTNPHDSTFIHPLISSSFSYNGQRCHLEDDSDGVVRIVATVNGKDIFVKQVGSIDYNSGTISLVDFNIDSFEGNEIRIYAIPRQADISVVGNNILELAIDELDININSLRQ